MSPPPPRRRAHAALALAGALTLPASARAQADAPGTLAGVVRDSTGHAVAEATVALGDAPPMRVAERDGTFTIRGVAGSVVLHVRALGYVPLDTTIAVPSGATVTATLVLARAAQSLGGVRVEGTAPVSASRRRAGSGVVIGREEIARRTPTKFSDVLRRVPGVSLVPVATQYGTTDYTFVMRGVATVKGQSCPIAYFLDGAPADATDGVDRLVSPATIDSLEVYQAGSQAPARFSAGTSGRCGVIAIWTRSR